MATRDIVAKFSQLSLDHSLLIAAVLWAIHQHEAGNPNAALATLKGELTRHATH